jgi:hypothetical protein
LVRSQAVLHRHGPRPLGRYVCHFSFRCGLLTAAQTKEDNRKNNAQKQESINRGKAAAKTRNAVVLIMSFGKLAIMAT